MSKEIMYCLNCNNILSYNEEDLKQCCLCKQKNTVIELELTLEDWSKILKISKDIDFLLAMDKLKKENIIEFNLKLSQFNSSSQQIDNNIPKCPTCNSTNIKKISTTKRLINTNLFGLASSNIGKTMQCENCGYKW